MAVEIKYVVVRGGVEKMTFASKKEADAYDKLLDTADELMTLLAGAPVQLAPEQQESLAFYLAEQRDLLQRAARWQGAGDQPQGREGGRREAQGKIPQECGLTRKGRGRASSPGSRTTIFMQGPFPSHSCRYLPREISNKSCIFIE